MAVTQADLNRYRLIMSRIPEEIRKSLSTEELADRLAEAESLGRRARDARDPVLRRGYAQLSQAMLAARPRDAVAKETRALVAKAEATPDGREAARLRRRAAELTEKDPPAPRRHPVAPAAAVAKAGRVLPVAIFDHQRRLAGMVADPARIVQRVTKAAKDKPLMQPVFNENGDLVGIVDPADIQPITVAGKSPAPAAAPAKQPAEATAADVAKARAAAAGEAAFARAALAGWRAGARATRTGGPGRAGRR